MLFSFEDMQHNQMNDLESHMLLRNMVIYGQHDHSTRVCLLAHHLLQLHCGALLVIIWDAIVARIPSEA